MKPRKRKPNTELLSQIAISGGAAVIRRRVTDIGVEVSVAFARSGPIKPMTAMALGCQSAELTSGGVPEWLRALRAAPIPAI